MRLRAHHIRIYALEETRLDTPNKHPLTPLTLTGFPSAREKTHVHVGDVPGDLLDGLKQDRTWRRNLLLGGVGTAENLRNLATEMSDDSILANEKDPRTVSKRYWFVSLIIDDVVELAEDHEQEIFGLELQAWIDFGESDYRSKYIQALDLLSTNVAAAIAPRRFRWVAAEQCLIDLPTGIALSPIRLIPGRVRAYSAPQLEDMNLSRLETAAAISRIQLPPMVHHYYLRAMTETDRIARFFDAFRGLEILIDGTSGSLANRFSLLARRLYPTNANSDIEAFRRMADWRNDLAHGNRKLLGHEAPDDQAFDLLHKYIANSIAWPGRR